jgi:hypothetical protein
MPVLTTLRSRPVLQFTLAAAVAAGVLAGLPLCRGGGEPVKADKSDAAADAGKAEEGYVSLFDGKTLNGWVVTECKADVEDGKLVILDGNGFIRNDKIYGDFILEVDWKNRKPEKYDSGIYFRSDLPRKNNHWPDRYQINLQQGQEGNIVAHKTAKSTGLARGGEWNHFRFTCIGPKASLEINGKPAWSVDDIKPPTGYIGIQVEVPGGGQFEFRNIRIKPLTPPTTAPATQP